MEHAREDRIAHRHARLLRAAVPALRARGPRSVREKPPPSTPYTAWLRAVVSGSAYDVSTGRLVRAVKGPDGSIVLPDPPPGMGPRGRVYAAGIGRRRSGA